MANQGKRPKAVLLFRLSALGDVAMTLPFVYESCRRHPEREVVFVTQSFPAKLFIDKPSNLRTLVFSKKEDKTLPFALNLHREYPGAEVVDLHSVPRTKWFSFILRLLGHKVTALRKPRLLRSLLLNREPEEVVPWEHYVPPMTVLYAKTLRKAGLFGESEGHSLPKGRTEKKIGLALFAQHEGKMLLPTQEEELVRLLSEGLPDFEILLYGANATYERGRREELSAPYPNVRVATHEAFEDELREISTLACMVSMDSANQHIARFLGIPVVSIWMQTHPAAGFLPFGMDEKDCIGVNLNCRPCSIYGNKPCKRRDWACKHRLELSQVLSAVKGKVRS